jgi:hypothetical protein
MTPRQQIEARLREQCPVFAEVAGAASVEAARAGAIRLPSASVVDLSERPVEKPNGKASACGVPTQRIQSFGVVVTVDSARDRTGADSADVNYAHRVTVEAALSQFVMDGYMSALAWASSAFAGIGNNRLSWLMEFEVTVFK